MTVEELLGRVSSAELAEWMALSRLRAAEQERDAPTAPEAGRRLDPDDADDLVDRVKRAQQPA